MDNIILLPQNLSKMGVKRIIPEPDADLITVWKTSYPVLTNYKQLCMAIGIPPFAGGTYKEQGSSYVMGFLTSGFRDSMRNSPHEFGFAIDMATGDLDTQIYVARIATNYFTRIGLYPQSGFLHLDLANLDWQSKYGGIPYWVRIDDKYTSFTNLEQAIGFAKGSI